MYKVGLVTIYGPDDKVPSKALGFRLLPVEHHVAFPWWYDSTIAVIEALTVEDVKDKTIIDVGCGASAILSLAAVALGAKSVLAIDHQPECVEFAKKQVEANKLTDKIKVVQYDDDSTADFILVNIGRAHLVGEVSRRSPHGIGTDEQSGVIRW